ncbi:low affinity iron permease family protein [Longitalea arenae]|uniref:low affinity iron permease family protein n=1 Tax=Longitalea arenae TaxID=2812558 RepID=UPI001968453C|nr:low affinity iron permease family protein [Longitalea arenae]
MRKKKRNKLSILFQKLANKATRATGSPYAFITAAAIVIVWAVTGPIFGYSDSWQLVINTGTTIVTFLMVFIIQQSQNKDTMAIQLKLNELIACHERASNRLIDVEDLTEEELALIKRFYIKLADLAEKEDGVGVSHSLSEAETLHRIKRQSHSKMSK